MADEFLTSSTVAWNLCSDNVDENDVESLVEKLRNDSLETVTQNTQISWFEVKSFTKLQALLPRSWAFSRCH